MSKKQLKRCYRCLFSKKALDKIGNLYNCKPSVCVNRLCELEVLSRLKEA